MGTIGQKAHVQLWYLAHELYCACTAFLETSGGPSALLGYFELVGAAGVVGISIARSVRAVRHSRTPPPARMFKRAPTGMRGRRML